MSTREVNEHNKQTQYEDSDDEPSTPNVSFAEFPSASSYASNDMAELSFQMILEYLWFYERSRKVGRS